MNEELLRNALAEVASIAEEALGEWVAVEPPYLPLDKAVLHDILLICNKALQDEEERKMSEEEMRLRGVLMQIAVIAHNGAMQKEAR